MHVPTRRGQYASRTFIWDIQEYQRACMHLLEVLHNEYYTLSLPEVLQDVLVQYCKHPNIDRKLGHLWQTLS